MNPAYQNGEIGTKPRPEPPPVQVVTRFSGDEFKRRCDYAVIVQCWRKSTHGRGKRLYEAQFTEEERELIAEWYKKFSVWHTQTGHPRQVECSPKTLSLLARACNFFAEV
jgi:hypothetical protein